MELVFKLYQDKPSKIGVKYVHEYQAIREYESLTGKYRGESFGIQLEFYKERVHLNLISENSGAKVGYKELEFKKEQLKKFQDFFKPGVDVEFVHVFPRSNTIFVVKPFRMAEFFKVNTFEIINLAGQSV